MNVFISRNNESFGPYSPDDVYAYLKDGSISKTDLAWYDGAEKWVPVSSLPFLIQEKHIPILPVQAHPTALPDLSGPALVAQIRDQPRKPRTITPFTVSWIGYYVSIYAIAALWWSNIDETNFEASTTAFFENFGFVFFALVLLSLVFWLSSIGLFWKLHHDAWRLLPSYLRTSSPVTSAWLLFMPIFNFYWFFRAHSNLQRQYSQWVGPEGSETMKSLRLHGNWLGILFLLVCLCFVIAMSTEAMIPIGVAWCIVCSRYYSRIFRLASERWAAFEQKVQLSTTS